MFATLVPGSASGIQTPVSACTSLVTVCVGSCMSDSVVRVTVIGDGYGEAVCGGAFASCITRPLTPHADAGTCSRASYTGTGSSTFICRVDAAGVTPTVAICTSEPAT